MKATELLISIPNKSVPAEWTNRTEIPGIGTLKPAPAAGFDTLFYDLILGISTGVTSSLLANWLYSKFSAKPNMMLRINGKEFELTSEGELQAEIDKADSEAEGTSTGPTPQPKPAPDKPA